MVRQIEFRVKLYQEKNNTHIMVDISLVIT